MPRVVQSWLRNYLACMAMYFAVGSLWVYYIYWCFGSVLFGPGKMPGAGDVFEQMRVWAIPRSIILIGLMTFIYRISLCGACAWAFYVWPHSLQVGSAWTH